ncbi:MAG: zinc-ribbon domain-containing protein [Thermoplasmata archaeon]|nr:zinc-ribbon domain-containing protein [Thermoplasmata archaeon]
MTKKPKIIGTIETTKIVCPVCGRSVSDSASTCPNCGTALKGMAGKTSGAKVQREEAINTFVEVLGLPRMKAELLVENGFDTVDELKDALEDELVATGLTKEEAAAVKRKLSEKTEEPETKTTAQSKTAETREIAGATKSDDALEKWLTGESETKVFGEVGKEKKSALPSISEKENVKKVESLKKWLEGDETALGEWLEEEKAAVAVAEKISTHGLDAVGVQLAEKEKLLSQKEEEIAKMKAEIESMKEIMGKYMDRVRSGAFDPMKLIEETAVMSKQLQEEVKKRKQMEEELDHVKKGTVAIIKYVKAQQAKAKDAELNSVKKRLENELREKEALASVLKSREEEIAKLKEALEKGIQSLPKDAQAYKKMEMRVAELEGLIATKEKEIEALNKTIAELREASATAMTNGASAEIRARMEEELIAKEKEFVEKESALQRRIIELEQENQNLRIERKLEQEALELRMKSVPEIEETLNKKIQELTAKEKELALKEAEIGRLREEIRFKEEEMRKLKDTLAFKEEEYNRREEDIRYREEKLQEELKKLAAMRAEIQDTRTIEAKRRLEDLEAEIAKKEEELRARERYLQAKSEELRLKERGLVAEEIEMKEAEREQEIKQEKVKSGVTRLDDLLYGGFPFGSNVLINGPPHVGKEVLMNLFMAEGLKKGVPGIFVITDKSIPTLVEELRFIVPSFEEYEKIGLVRYVDAYSKSMGEETNNPNAIYIDEPTDTKGIAEAVDTIAKEFKKKHKYYRLTFESISTIIAYLDTASVFKFLQPFCGKRKRDRAVALYTIETGMHSESDIQMLGHMMDGSIEFKLEQLKTYLSVKGICDVQSRAWIQYNFSKNKISIGSFSLDHIR